MKTYNEEHEAFVSNLKGSSAFCVFVALMHGPPLILFLKLIQGHRQPRIFRDYAFLVLPLLASMTIFADAGYLSLAVLIISEVYILRRNINNNIAQNKQASREDVQDVNISTEKSFISLFKGYTMLLTCICILAVDFRIFPRRFAKTEMFGTSLMDVGIGGFIVSSAITSKFARGVELPVKNSNPSKSHHTERLLGIFALRNIVVFVLGIGRMIVIKLFNYHEKVSEYGEHWNFFVTLSAIWIISDLLHMIIPRRFIVSFSMCWLAAYQFLLSQTKLTYFIFSSPRTNFFWANREGICSLLGFLPLYLVVESFSSRYIFHEVVPAISPPVEPKDSQTSLPGDVEKNSEVSAQPSDSKLEGRQHTYLWIPMSHYHFRVSRALTYASAFAWIAWLLLARIQPTSRRLTNSAYIMLILAMSSSLLLFIIIADVAAGLQTRIVSLDYINSHQLIVFLGCNLVTGLINLSMKTIYIDRYLAFGILALYCFMILAIAWISQHIHERKKMQS